eukprot:1980594-Rhodomonas_salina.1
MLFAEAKCVLVLKAVPFIGRCIGDEGSCFDSAATVRVMRVAHSKEEVQVAGRKAARPLSLPCYACAMRVLCDIRYLRSVYCYPCVCYAAAGTGIAYAKTRRAIPNTVLKQGVLLPGEGGGGAGGADD